LVYSFFYVPEVSSYVRNLFYKNQIKDTQETKKDDDKLKEEAFVRDFTLPNLSILASDNFKNTKFGNLNIKFSSKYTSKEEPEKLNLKIDEENEINGFYYPLTSSPRTDVDTSRFNSELLKNNYTLTKKANIPDDFIKNIFKFTLNSTVSDVIDNKKIDYVVTDLIINPSPNIMGFFLNSNNESRYKFIFLTPNKLYIFNVKSDKSNYLNMQKTFYNLELQN